jgi:aryl-alcohol dehydrogenase-like predicted oxidoreductase
MCTAPTPLTTLAGAALSRLGLGCSRIGSFGNPEPPLIQRQAIATAMDLGINVFDTANVYGQGDSERTLGRVLGPMRERAFIITKVGKRFSAKARLMQPLKPLILLTPLALRQRLVTKARGSNIAADFACVDVAAELNASLLRLGTKAVDALLLHSPSAAALADPRLGEALRAALAAGKTRYVGVSCDDASALGAALEICGVSLVQIPLALIDTAEGAALARLARSRGIAVHAREAIRTRPDLEPVAAVSAAVQRQEADCLIVGASHPDRLRQLARAAA